MESTRQICNLPGCHEPFCAISHLLGAGLFLILGSLLLYRGRGNRSRMIFLGIYAASCVFLLSMSGVCHMMVRGEAAHRVLLRLDHSAIFVLIAGTFTPPHGILFRGFLRWGPLVFIWTAAVAGITLKTVFFDDVAEWVGLTFYLTLGWLGTISGILLAQRYGLVFIKPLLLGGAAYSVGGVADFMKSIVLVPGVIHAHEVFHLAVLVGVLFHFQFIWHIARA